MKGFEIFDQNTPTILRNGKVCLADAFFPFILFLLCFGLLLFPFRNAKYFFPLINVGSKSFLTRI